MGTWEAEKGDRRTAVEVLRRGVDAGMAHVDTAEMYGSGRAEEIVGEALRGIRDRVFLVSKVLPGNATRAGTVAACERSLRRLGTDRLDLYLLHWPSEHPLEGTVAGMEDLVRAGKTRAWGVSNFDEALLAETVRIAGPGRVACDQVLHHLEERAIEHAVIPFCEREGIAVVAYSPFGSGGPFPKDADGRRALERIAAARGVSPRQVALAWTVRRAPVFTIPRTWTLAHALENAAAGDLVLSGEEEDRLDAAFPRGPKPRDLPTI
jgi:diketogulonate reductase-like aldo/keto reductase